MIISELNSMQVNADGAVFIDNISLKEIPVSSVSYRVS